MNLNNPPIFGMGSLQGAIKDMGGKTQPLPEQRLIMGSESLFHLAKVEIKTRPRLDSVIFNLPFSNR